MTLLLDERMRNGDTRSLQLEHLSSSFFLKASFVSFAAMTERLVRGLLVTKNDQTRTLTVMIVQHLGMRCPQLSVCSLKPFRIVIRERKQVPRPSYMDKSGSSHAANLLSNVNHNLLAKDFLPSNIQCQYCRVGWSTLSRLARFQKC